jgi:hypothetical protein
MNVVYSGPTDCPAILPVFPLGGALLLPRGALPLNIFEPRYLAMVDHALKTDRMLGMIQPDETASAGSSTPKLFQVGCAGRVTQFAETGDGRVLVTLTGVARYRIVEELKVATPFRQCRVDYAPFAVDFQAREGEGKVDRDAVIDALKRFAEANDLKVDWKGIREAPNEALVNALCMMSPYGPQDKQALLEAPDLKSRGDLLVAITDFELARRGSGGETKLQ